MHLADLRRSRSGEKSRNLLNRALRALSKDRSTAHVADSLARLSSAESSDLVAGAAHRPLPAGVLKVSDYVLLKWSVKMSASLGLGHAHKSQAGFCT
jgi:hypothetical protein